MELRGKSISYSSYKKKQNEQHENDLIKEIELVEQSLTEENIETIEKLREELRKIRKAKMQGYLIRSRTQITEDDEKPTNYFCNLEKHHCTSKIIPKLEKSNDTCKHVLSNADIKKLSQDESRWWHSLDFSLTFFFFFFFTSDRA